MRADITDRAVERRAAYGPLAAELLQLELNGEARPLIRRRLAKILREVRRLDRQAARGSRRALTRRDLWILGAAAIALVAAAYLVVRG